MIVRCQDCGATVRTLVVRARTRCADCRTEHRDIAHVRAKRRRLARRASLLARVTAASLPSVRRYLDAQREGGRA